MILHFRPRYAIIGSALGPDRAIRAASFYPRERNQMERPVTFLRKVFFLFLAAAAALFLCCAASADTAVPLAPAPGSLTLRDGRTILTRENLDKHNDLLRQIGVTKEDLLADWQNRGVLVQAWSPIQAKYSCLEISVAQDAESAQYNDLANHADDKAAWKAYKAAVKGSESWSANGYTVQSVEQKRANGNNYLLMKYKRSAASGDYRGYMARTVFRGYTLTVDYRIYNRQFLKQDPTDVFNVMKTLVPVETEASAAAGDGSEASAPSGTQAASAQPKAELVIEDGPPRETNTNKFTVTGTTVPGAQVVVVLMRLTSDQPLLFETTSHARTGKFSVKVTLPEAEETYWTMTMEVNVDDKRVAEEVFDTIQYKKTLIPVTYTSEIPESIAGDELKITGKTIKGVQIQCLVTRPQDTWQKTVTTNGTGRFSFTVPTKEEGEYNVTLVFTKKGFETKNPSYTVYRNMSEEDRRVKIRKEAVRIGYNTLVKRIDQYAGKTMAFNNIYVTDIEEIGDEWKISVACSKAGDRYTQPMVFMADAEPAFAVDEQHNFFGKCRGPYLIQSEEMIETIPSFDLLFWD